jgi:hypothetical protein
MVSKTEAEHRHLADEYHWRDEIVFMPAKLTAAHEMSIKK